MLVDGGPSPCASVADAFRSRRASNRRGSSLRTRILITVADCRSCCRGSVCGSCGSHRAVFAESARRSSSRPHAKRSFRFTSFATGSHRARQCIRSCIRRGSLVSPIAGEQHSVVLDVRVGRRAILLTGDIERDAESAFASRLDRVDILKVAHHGSRTSSTAALLDRITPRVAFISCGRHNLFGHPHPEVLDALHARGVRVWRTDRSGTMDVRFSGDQIFVHRQIDTLK